MTRTVLVTGASGFVGSHLTARLRSIGESRIIGFGRRGPDVGPWDLFVDGDITDRDHVLGLVGDVRPDEIYHLAGITRGSAADFEAVNLTGTRNLLGAAAALSPSAAVVVAGSAAEYGRTAAVSIPLTEGDRCEPVDPYGQSKYAATLETLAAADAGLRANVVRPFNLVGAGVPESLAAGAIVSRLRTMVSSGDRVLRMGDVDCLRDFTDVGDAVEGMVALARSAVAGRVFNLCTGHGCSVRELIAEFARIAGVDVTIMSDPALGTGSDIPISVGSHAAATAAFGFRPGTPLTDSLRAAWAASPPRAVPA